MTRAELKRNAREKLGGKLFGPNWVNAVLVMAIFYILRTAINGITGLGTLIMLVIPVIMIILMLKGWNLIGTLIVCDLVGFVLCLVFGFIEPAKMVDAAGPIGAGLTGMLNVICFSFFMFALLEMLTRSAAIAGVEGALELEVTINEQIRAVRPIKLEDRLRHMNEKNPLLAELRRELDLEVE